MEPLGLKIMLLLLTGNTLVFIRLHRNTQNLQSKYTRLTDSTVWGTHVIQISNTIEVVATIAIIGYLVYLHWALFN